MVQRCCFCISLRTGTILLALLNAVTSTAGAYVYWTWNKDIPYMHTAVRIILALAWTYRAAVGFTALTAAVSRKYKFVRIVAVFVSLAALVATASAAFNLTVMWRNQRKFRTECSERITDYSDEEWDPMSHLLSGPFRKRQVNEQTKHDPERVQAICSKAVTGFLVLITVVEIVLVLFLFYFSVVTTRYRNDLKDKKKFVRHRLKSKLTEKTRVIPTVESKLGSTLSASSDESIDLNDDRKLRRV